MSIVKSNKFSPQSLPIVQIDGFNDVESFVVGVSQTSFTSPNFDSKSAVRAFRYNEGIQEWEEITVVFTTQTDFEIFEGVSDNDEFLVFYQSGYYQNDESIDDIDVDITSSNTVVSGFDTLKLLLDSIGESAFLESYKDYGIGETTLPQVDLTSSQTVPTGLYILFDTGFSGGLIQLNTNGVIKQLYLPFGQQTIFSRDNDSGSMSAFTEIGGGSSGFTERTVEVIGNTSYTLTSGDEEKILRFEALQSTINLPADASQTFPIGSIVEVINTTQPLNFTPAGGTVTMNSSVGGSFITLAAGYNSAKIIKTGVDEWDVYGNNLS